MDISIENFKVIASFNIEMASQAFKFIASFKMEMATQVFFLSFFFFPCKFKEDKIC